jgi:hypothetical protein
LQLYYTSQLILDSFIPNVDCWIKEIQGAPGWMRRRKLHPFMGAAQLVDISATATTTMKSAKILVIKYPKIIIKR